MSSSTEPVSGRVVDDDPDDEHDDGRFIETAGSTDDGGEPFQESTSPVAWWHVVLPAVLAVGPFIREVLSAGLVSATAVGTATVFQYAVLFIGSGFLHRRLSGDDKFSRREWGLIAGAATVPTVAWYLVLPLGLAVFLVVAGGAYAVRRVVKAN